MSNAVAPAASGGDEAARELQLALARLGANEAAAALVHARRAAELDEASALAWLVAGAALNGLGQPEPAALALERSIAIDPGWAAAHFSLGLSYLELDRLAPAETCLLRAVALDPANKEAHAALSTLYCRADRFEAGRESALAALKLDPHLLTAHQNLAAIFAREGRDDEARRHRDLAYGTRNLFVSTAPDALQHVLVLMSADAGNTPDRYLLPADRYSRVRWFIEYAREAQFAALPDFDVVFNAIADPDLTARTAPNVARFLETCTRPVLNPPDRIGRTSRDQTAGLLTGIEGLVVPQTARIEAGALATHGLVKAARLAGVAPPFLVRPVGSHGGQGLALITDGDDSVAIGEVYVTAFHDFRSADGLYRKYRMIFVDRRPLPYHLAIGPRWMVHYEKSGTAEHPDRLAEEDRFLADPDAALGAAAMAAIRAIGQAIDLDFCGLDFSIAPDGRVLVFEANATMLVHPELADGPLAHKNPAIETIFTAFRAMLSGT